jgi:hypothetical protein
MAAIKNEIADEFSHSLCRNNAKEIPKNTAQYSIKDALLHCREKALKLKTVSTANDESMDRKRRQNNHMGTKQSENQIRLAIRLALSGSFKKSLIRTAAEN